VYAAMQLLQRVIATVLEKKLRLVSSGNINAVDKLKD
jgi:hypothetical protein